MNYASITPCGESCDGCAKREAGQCRGCLATGGRCEEWKGSGRCPVFTCAEAHGAAFCGVCSEFPCPRLPELLKWRPDCVRELRQTAVAWRQWQERGGG